VISVDDYRARVLAGIAALHPTSTPLLDALGLVVADDIRTSRPMPGFDNSSMDGYAVRSSDFAGASGDVVLTVIDDLPAGAGAGVTITAGCAARIMTGAPVPAGADCVVPIEQTDGGVSTVTVQSIPTAGAYIRRAGEDLPQGSLAVPRGSIVTTRNLALIASCDLSAVPTRPRPRVVVMSTGSELVAPGSAVAFGQVIDCNSYLLAAAAAEAGAEVTRIGPVSDSFEEFTAALEQHAATSDLIITSGGVSMGAYDTVKEVLTARGGVEFLKVAMNPGMPQGFGRVDGVPIITLPGNPVSTYVSFEAFVRPAIRKMLGHANLLRPERTATITESITSPGGKRQFARGTVSGRDRLEVAPVGGQGSHVIGGLSRANCIIVIPETVTEVRAGSSVSIIDLRADDDE
jgi:molybdopterin molybdotransferase